MKKIYITMIALFVAISTMGNTSNKKTTNKIPDWQEMFKACQLVKANNNSPDSDENKNTFNDFLAKLKRLNNVNPEDSRLKSGTANSHKLDSLIVDRWNDNTGQLEPAQLEKWTWYENDLGKSWELYDLDSLTGQWLRNDKEEYEWDSNGNKITRLDFDPDSTGNGWHENGLEHYNYNESGQLTLYLLKMKDTLTNDWVNNSKIEYSYDENGNEILALHFDIDTINNWVNNYKEENAFDENGYNTYTGIIEWNNTFNTWDTLFFYRLEYDANGHQILNELAFDSYFMHSKSESSYNSEGHKIQSIASEWDFTTNKYVYTQKEDFTYDANGNEISRLTYKWDQTASDWSESWKINYEYDSSGNLIYRDRYDIADSTNAFVLSWKNDYTYDDKGNITYRISHDWDASDSTWIKNYEQNYSYDDYGNTIFENKLVWDTTANDWIGDYEENYTYDASGNTILENKLVWDTITNQFVTEFQHDYSYDFEIQFTDIIFPPEYEYWHISNLKYFDQYANMMLQKTYSEVKDGQLVVSEKFNFFYSPLSTTGIAQIQPVEIKVYPNPADNYLIFDGINATERATVNLFNLQGKKLLSEELSGHNKVMLNHLNGGIYIYELKKGTEVFRGKILKR